MKRAGVARCAEDSCPAPVQCPFCLERPAPSTVETGICRGWQVMRCCFLSRTSTASTTARCAGRRQGWAGARPAASCPLPCVWFPGSPITTPSRTASPGELHTLPEKLAYAPSRRPPPWAARLLPSHTQILPLLVKDPETPETPETPDTEISALISNGEDDHWILGFIL